MLVYREDQHSETNQGSLTRKNSVKTMYVHEASDARKCPVCLFMKYVNLLILARACKKLYFRPKIKPSPKVWYCDQPYGNNKVGKTVRELCTQAGFKGNFTNQSLITTSASHMDHSNVPKQVYN